MCFHVLLSYMELPISRKAACGGLSVNIGVSKYYLEINTLSVSEETACSNLMK